MKTFANIPFLSIPSVTLAVALCLGLTVCPASADDLFFNNANGGDGTWEPDAGGTPWFDGNTSTSNVPWDNTQGDIAHFQGAGGTVNVAADVTTDYMVFNAGSDETLNGTGTITVVTPNGVLENDSSNNVTINNNIQLDDSQVSDRFDINDGGANTVTLNGNISYVGSDVRPSGQALIFNGGANTNFVLNGSFQGNAQNAGRLVLSGGTMTLNGNYTNANPSNLLEVDSGNVILGTSTLGTGEISLGGGAASVTTLLTKGAQHITNTVLGLNFTGGGSVTGSVIIGGSTADLTTFDSIGTVVTGVTLTAATGGRVVVGALNGNGDPTGLIKVGAGTVVLATGSNEPIFNVFNGQTAPYAADIRQGTVLINNSTGSAFGINDGSVNVEAGATLGGHGSTGGIQKVIAVDATSVIAPGDAGQANLGIAPTIGDLNLNGGLNASTGVTMNFKLDGDFADPSSDIGVHADALTLGDSSFGGLLTINISNIGTAVDTTNPYILIDGNGTWTEAASTTFAFTTPTGYALDFTYGDEDGYIFDTQDDLFSVKFVATPEPSTYALMGLGLLALVAIHRSRKLRA